MTRRMATRLAAVSLTLTALLLSVSPLAGTAAAQVTLPAGFSAVTRVSGLTAPRGFVARPQLQLFPCCIFIVEPSLQRISVSNGGPPVAFANMAPFAPVDVVAPEWSQNDYPLGGNGPFGDFLYVAQSDAVPRHRIYRVDGTGFNLVFAALPAAPQRMAFSPALGAFGSFLFVTLANGQLVKIDPTGTVTPCASGLAGPQGLVFGPGGSAYKTTLFVAESAANRISRVDSTCTVTPFATTGLTSPMGLAISPGGGWGPVDTLFVENAGTRIDQVDKNGTVTPFASGFTQADTVRIDFLGPLSGRLGMGALVYASDATAGTVTAVFLQGPSITSALVGCDPCHAGDTFALNITFGNPGPLALPVEVKGGFELPDGTPVNFAPALLNDKHFETVVAARAASTTMTWLSLPVPAIAPGRYCYVIGVGDPELFDGSVRSNRACFSLVP